MLNKRYKISVFIGFVMSLFWYFPAYGAADLWLPIAYQHHYNKLLQASKIAASDPECYELITGQLAENRSSQNHPVFKFYCRTEFKRQFAILIDGLTLELTSISRERAKLRAAKKQAVMDQELEEKRKKIAQFWEDCYRLFKRETQLFDSVKVTSQIPPESKISSWGRITYRFNFSAKSLQKRPIAYHVIARIEKADKCKIQIKPI